MKKFIIFAILYSTIPIYAACSIETGGACSIAEVMQPPIQRSYSNRTPLVKEFSGTQNARLQPQKNDIEEKRLRDFGPQINDYSYNANCQFGICNTTGEPKPFLRREN